MAERDIVPVWSNGKALMDQPVRTWGLMERDKMIGKRILLVEDESLVRRCIGQLLASDDHTVVEANNGAEALSLFTQAQFDLVMTDFEIPFVRGDELAARIKRLAPQQPILMITGYQQRPGPDNPVDAVLNKPIHREQLRETMARLLSAVG